MGKTAFFLLAFGLCALLISGCSGPESSQNVSGNASGLNGTENVSVNATGNQTSNSTASAPSALPSWPMYNSSKFSFAYPPDMNMSETRSGENGIITGEHMISTGTGELLAVMYVDVNYTYGENRDAELRANPTSAASDFLAAAQANDSMGFLDKADYIGNITTFSLGRDSYVAYAPFTITTDLGTKYTGRALSAYIPERSLLVDVRILALDPDKADLMKEEFVYTLRPS